MSRRQPLLAAAGIATLTMVAGGVSAAMLLALLGYTTSGADIAPDAAMVGAETGAVSRPPTPDDAAAVALLERAGRATDTVAYSGVAFTAGGSSANPISVKVFGIPGVGTIVDSPDGSAVLAGQGRSVTLADFTRVLDLLVANYRVVRHPSSDRTVAGRPSEAVEALRPDGSLAARFWIDRAAGLLLRRDLVGRGGNTTSSTWFGELTVGPATVTHPPPLAADPWSHLLDAATRASWRAAGCTCAESLPDGMTLLQARTDDAGAAAGPGRGIVHLLYSDGLTEMSIFDQPGQLAASAPDELSQKGFEPVSYAGVPVLERITPAERGLTPVATGEWVWECGGSVLTLVAPATPRSSADDRAGHVVAALSQRPSAAPAADGPVSWVRRGWDRVVLAARQSWEHLTASSGPSQDGALHWSHGSVGTA